MSAICVVLEGADGAGKSTYANMFDDTSKVPLVMIHNGPPEDYDIKPGGLYWIYKVQLKLAVARRKREESTVIDRSWVSEVVYGPMYRGKSLLSKKEVRKLEDYCDKHNIVRLGVVAPLSTRIMRLWARGEPIDKRLGAVGIEYDKYFSSHPGWTTTGDLPKIN